MMMMAKYMKQELASDAEEEGLVPTLPGRFTSMRKVPSLSDLSDPDSSLGKSLIFSYSFFIHNYGARIAAIVTKILFALFESHSFDYYGFFLPWVILTRNIVWLSSERMKKSLTLNYKFYCSSFIEK